VACRSFVSELATVRLDAWNHGDKRRGKDRTLSNLGISLDASRTEITLGTSTGEPGNFTPGKYSRQPRALELAREIVGFRESQSETLGLTSPIKGFRRAHRPGKPSLYVSVTEAARVSAAVADAGAALAGMVAARRIFDRGAWIVLTRRALLGILAALVSLEAQLAGEAGNNYPLDERRATARRLALLTLGNRGARFVYAGRCEVPEGFALAHGPTVEALVAEGWPRWDACVYSDRASVRCLSLLVPAMVGGLCEASRAARARGFETDQIDAAPVWAFDPAYSPAELEEAAPLHPAIPDRDVHPERREKGEPKKRDYGAAQANRTEKERQRYAAQCAAAEAAGKKMPRRPKPEAKPPNRRTCRHDECTTNYLDKGEVRCLRVDASRVKK
jgi:hypothetical protein